MATYYTLDQVSEQLHAPRESVRHWIKSGRLQAYKPGRHLLVKREELEALIESNAIGAVRTKRARRAGGK